LPRPPGSYRARDAGMIGLSWELDRTQVVWGLPRSRQHALRPLFSGPLAKHITSTAYDYRLSGDCPAHRSGHVWRGRTRLRVKINVRHGADPLVQILATVQHIQLTIPRFETYGSTCYCA
jgi:hypothetical protein